MPARTRWLVAAAAAEILVLFSPAISCAAEKSLPGDRPEKKVLLIGIDGCRPDALSAAHTPHLDALVKQGAYASGTQILGERYQQSDTVSGPGWGSILTGVWADKHGIDGNEFKHPRINEYPSFLARIEAVRPELDTVAIVSWKPLTDHILRVADDIKLFDGEARDPHDYDAADRESTEAAREILRNANPDAMFLYFGNVDETGHAHGFHPTVPEYIEAIEEVDRRIGTVLDAMASRPTIKQEDWLILVGTDHGGQGTAHGGGHAVPAIRETFLIVSGPSAIHGKITQPTYLVDLAVTALAHLEIPIDPAWCLDGRAVDLKQLTCHDQ